MTAPTVERADRGLAPACRIGEHPLCPGPGEIRLPSQAAWERPVETLRCSCSCHT